uniref:Fibronectin type-III domain-containing protein n=1 Tax=Cynoglossus semilaevis TaxID=244447 RepID=A0A3P8W7N5_CYNSE
NYCIKGTSWDAEGRQGDDYTACQITSSGRTFGVFVYWIPVQGGDTYVVWISDGENCTATSESFCSIDPVECGESYTVSIVASNNAGSSEPSVPTQFVTPCPPENIWVDEPEPSNCTLMWDPVALVDFYIAYIKRDDGYELSCNTSEASCNFFCMC